MTEAIDALLSRCPITVFRSLFIPVEGVWRDGEEVPPYFCRPLDARYLLIEFEFPAGWAPYQASSGWRIDGSYDGKIHWSALVVEVDAVDHAYDPAYFKIIEDSLDRAVGDGDLYPPNMLYASKSGIRIIWFFDSPTAATMDEYRRRWWARCVDVEAALEPYLGDLPLFIDRAPKDPTRLWRVPFYRSRMEEIDTWDRPVAFPTTTPTPWGSFRVVTEEEAVDARLGRPAKLPKPIILLGDTRRRIETLMSKVPVLAEFMVLTGKPITASGTGGCNDLFSRALGSCALRLQHDESTLEAVVEMMLRKIERLGGDAEAWRRGRAQYTLRWAQREAQRFSRRRAEDG